ncbi:MAG: sigma-70 family RNA polymerase sigma factor [Chloroflexi bacterium]|nr:MAG: sigma-70 family RNA polymerase sigma factor [Chloroflexota bacterium]
MGIALYGIALYIVAGRGALGHRRLRAGRRVAFRRLARVSGMSTLETDFAELPTPNRQRPQAWRVQTEPVRGVTVLTLAGLPAAQSGAPNTAEVAWGHRSSCWTLLDLYQAYEPQVAARCRAYLRNSSDAEDASQETFLLLTRYLDHLEPNCGTYVVQTARTGCYKELRRRRRVYPTERLRAAAPDACADSLLDWRESIRSVWSKLTNRERRLIGYAFAGFSYREIGERLGLTENCVGVAMVRARARARRVASRERGHQRGAEALEGHCA